MSSNTDESSKVESKPIVVERSEGDKELDAIFGARMKQRNYSLPEDDDNVEEEAQPVGKPIDKSGRKRNKKTRGFKDKSGYSNDN